MKYKKQFAAALLSILLAAGMALPSFAQPETDSDTTAQTEQTEQAEEASDAAEVTQSDDSENADSTDADADDADNDGNADDADDTNQSEQEEQTPTDSMPTISINAKASLLVNSETGEVLHAENEHEKLYPASCTKIMTALLALENCNLGDTVTMQSEDFTDVSSGASSAGLKVGEQISVEDLLYCMMLPSGNEAANALARVTAGSVEDFVKMMNDRAAELGCTNTHFVNPNGLHDDDHYTSAYDLFLISQQAMQDSTFATIVNTAQKKLPATNMNDERVIYTTNDLIFSSSSNIYYDNCYGIKTGHTTPAGYCLVAFAKQSGYTYYSVILGAEAGSPYAGSFTETVRMFDWAFDNFSMQTATEAGEAVTECPVRLGRGADHVTLVTSSDISVLIPNNATKNDLDTKITVDESYDAPIEAGQKLGTVTYSFDGMECASADLVALSAVERSPVLYVLDQIASFFRITYVRIAVAVIIIIFVIYLILSFIAGRNRRRNRRRKKARKRKQQNKQNVRK